MELRTATFMRRRKKKKKMPTIMMMATLRLFRLGRMKTQLATVTAISQRGLS